MICRRGHRGCKMANIQPCFICILLLYITSSQGNSVIVEKGQPTNLHCTFPNNVTRVTWKLMNGGTSVNLSTCSVVDTRCTDYVPSLYQGFSSNSGNNKIFGLNVTSARTNETEFLCLADNGLQSNVIMEVYAWPKVPVCHVEINRTFVDYTCHTTNVFPNVIAVLHRIEKELTNADFDPSYTECVRGDYGSGSEGDYRVSCSFRIPAENMLLQSLIYVEMTAAVSNMSAINRAAAVSYDVVTKLRVPRVFIFFSIDCDDFIPIGAKSYCKCEIIDEGSPEGSAAWFTQDGRIVEGTVLRDKSIYLKVVYNYSDTNQSYECRPITPLRANVTSISYMPTFIGDNFILEKGTSTNLECSFPHNVTSISWQLMRDDVRFNLSSCSFVDNNCSNQWPSLYRGYIPSSASNNSMGLNILRIRSSDTQFVCVDNDGRKSNITQLEVYVWPTKPNCTQAVYDTYIAYTCTTEVYPALDAVIHIGRVNFTEDEPIDLYPTYSVGENGEKSASIIWNAPINKYTPSEMVVYVEMNASVSNMSLINKTAVFSDNIITKLSSPVVVVNKCPLGPGVHGETIRMGTTATCRCELMSEGLPPGYASWFDDDNYAVGDDDVHNNYSTLSFSYDDSNPTQTYYCKPVSALGGDVLVYKPIFISSAHHVIGLQPLLIILGAVCTGIVSATPERYIIAI